jgi:hypothetical protein
MSFSASPACPEHHRARRIGARRLLPAVTSPNRSRTACSSLCHTTSRKELPMPQARPASARGLRLSGRLPPLLPQKAWELATQTRPRHPGVASIARTPHYEYPKSPARIAARAPPDLLGHPRPTASSYPPLPLPAAAIRRSPSHCLVCLALIVYPLLEILDRAFRCDSRGQPVQSNCVLTQVEPFTEATVAAGRGESVTREIQDEAPRTKAAEYQAAGSS